MKIRIEIDESLINEVDTLAKQQGLSRAEVTRDLYSLYIESKGNPAGFDVLPTLYALDDLLANIYLELRALKVEVAQLKEEVRAHEDSRSDAA